MSERNTTSSPEEKRVIGSEQARGGVISGRVITVLIAGLILSGIAMWFLLGVNWRTP